MVKRKIIVYSEGLVKEDSIIIHLGPISLKAPKQICDYIRNLSLDNTQSDRLISPTNRKLPLIPGGIEYRYITK